MFCNFRADTSGGVATMAGVTFGLVSIAAAAGLDYSNATRERHSLQDATDAAVLAGASMQAENDRERIERAKSIFLESRFCQSQKCQTPVVKMQEGALSLEAAAMIPTSLLQIAGVAEIEVGAVSKAVPATEVPLDVVMILDYSGSMNGANKYQDMAAAAKQFVQSMDEQPGDTMSVGVVPFSQYVLTPMQGRYLFDVTAGNALTGQTVIGCILNREHPYSTNAETPQSSTQGSLWPVFSYTTGSSPSSSSTFSDPPTSSEGYLTNTWTYNNPNTGEPMTFKVDVYDNDPGSTINGVVAQWRPDHSGMDFDGNGRFHLVYRGSPSGHSGGVIDLGPPPTVDPFATFGGYGGSTGWTVGDDSGLPTVFDQAKLAESLSGSCGQYATNYLWVRPLSKDFSDIKTAIGNMRPIGLTNIALGLDIGWHALTPAEPFKEANKKDSTQKVAILLTDGVQTVSAHGDGGAVSIGSANTNIAESCEAMKKDNVEIFTIAFGINDAYTRDLLKKCATSEPHYFEPSAGGDLDAVFEGIFQKVISGQVRLTG